MSLLDNNGLSYFWGKIKSYVGGQLPSDFTGATTTSAGAHGLVPAPTTADTEKFLRGDGTWMSGGRPMVILSYGSSTWDNFIEAYKNNVIVYCRASSNSNPATGAQNRMAFMAYVNDSINPTNVEFQYYRSVSSHSATQQGDQVYVYKLDKTAGWTVTVRESYTKIIGGTNTTTSYSSGALTINATDTDTWRNISVNGVEKLGTAKTTGSVGFINGLNTTVTYNDTNRTIQIDTDGGTTTDEKVAQNATTANAEYRVLLSGSADDTDHTERANKSLGFRYNPSIYAVMEGYATTAADFNAHAEGTETYAGYENTHAEGNGSQALGYTSHAEGNCTTASGDYSHSEGYYTWATTTGKGAHVEGYADSSKPHEASGIGSHVEGYGTSATCNKASGDGSHAEGQGTYAQGKYSHAEGQKTTAKGNYSHAEGSNTYAGDSGAHAEGYASSATGNLSHAESRSLASANCSHAEGSDTTASGDSSHAEGSNTYASGGYCHTEGNYTKAEGYGAHAEGTNTTANGTGAHSEGNYTRALAYYAHSEGYGTTANSQAAHAEGQNTYASGTGSHVEGNWTTASGSYSHAEGSNTVATHQFQHVFGEYNLLDASTAGSSSKGTYVEIVGNGRYNARSNARTLDWSGNETISGILTDMNGKQSIKPITYDNFQQLSQAEKDNGLYYDIYDADPSMFGFDKNVKQLPTTTDANYEILFSNTADNTERTEETRKTSSFIFNPYESKLTLKDNSGRVKLSVNNTAAAKSLSVSESDITLSGNNNFWDGTNTSLKTAITDIKSNLTEYVTLRARGGVTKNSYVDYTLDDAYTKYKKVVFVIDGNGIYTPMELYSFLITTAETRVNFYYNNTMVGTLNIKRVNDTKLSISMGNNDSITYAMTIYGVTV